MNEMALVDIIDVVKPEGRLQSPSSKKLPDIVNTLIVQISLDKKT